MSGNGNYIADGLEIAVIGMAGRFPGAKNIQQLLANLKGGVESISFFTDEELEGAGVGPELVNDPNYVRARGIVEDIEYFDASFFDYTPTEAKLMCPQMRLFHECSWEAFEDAGVVPGSYDGLIGVYSGANSSFSWEALCALSGENRVLGTLAASHLSGKDMLASKTAYRFNLKGPVFSLHTACSTSMVAVHLACQGILSGECDAALAGGVCINLPQKGGYLYSEGMMVSSDGHVRAFDAEAKGTVFSNGIGVVILKRLEYAVKDKDHIYAIIRGSAINNDGNRKVGFTAPSVEGQEDVIRTVYQVANVEPESVSYIEAHGTGTILGDPIEFEALRKAFNTGKKQFCALGTVKTNLGHLDTAGGVTGFIKAVLSLKHRLLFPSLNYSEPNPRIDIENSPFYVVTKLTNWTNGRGPLRAGVSGMGLGGTNAHILLEETPEIYKRKDSPSSREHKLLLFSAKTPTALDKMTGNFVEFLKENPHVDLADVAYTLQVGRSVFPYRRMAMCRDNGEAVTGLSAPDSRQVQTYLAPKDERTPVIFLLPGLGGQYVNMGLGLYRTETAFRKEMDACFEILIHLTGIDIKEILYPPAEEKVTRDPVPGAAGDNMMDNMMRPEISQITVFIFEYSLARMLMAWGIKPRAMIGYSFGEYTAACLSGVLSLEDALALIVARGKLIMRVPEGLMVSAPLTVERLKPFLKDNLSIAVDNGSSCIVSGSTQVVEAFELEMKKNRIMTMRLPQTSRAIHSQMMEPILEEFEAAVSRVSLHEPRLPYISNVTGGWASDREVTVPQYWTRHLRETVRFADGIEELRKIENAVFVEVGPGRDITTLLTRYAGSNPGQRVLNLVRHPQKNVSDDGFLLKQTGRLWLYGVDIDWDEFYKGEKRWRLPLPAYPFERKRHWIEGNPLTMEAGQLQKGLAHAGIKKDIADWFYSPAWKPAILPKCRTGEKTAPSTCLVFIDQCGLGTQLVARLEQDNRHVVTVRPGPGFKREGEGSYTVDFSKSSDYKNLFKELETQNISIGEIIHMWSIGGRSPGESRQEWFRRCQYSGYYSLVFISREIGGRESSGGVRITVVSSNMQGISGEDLLYPEKATLLGPVNIIPKEYHHLKCRSIDIDLPEPGSWNESRVIGRLVEEINAGAADTADAAVVYRGAGRMVRFYEPLKLEKVAGRHLRLRDRGVYLVTGGLGAIGLLLAEHLARLVRARLILTGRSPFPDRNHWEQWLETHPGDDATALKIKKLLEVEALGAEVMVLCADVADQAQMEEALRRAEKKFGPVNGVIHTALQIDGGLIHSITEEKTENVFSGKARGTLVLDGILEKEPLDFFILFSSMSSVLMPVGQVAYAAASAFLDAFALYNTAHHHLFTASIDWDTWQEVGGALHLAQKHSRSLGLSESQGKIEKGILSAEGMEAFSRIVETGLPRLVVTTRDLDAQIESSKTAVSDALNSIPSSKKKYRRPQLDSPYAAPCNHMQQTLADIWGDFFGFHGIGIHDDFFELGGDSLKAIILTSHIHRELDIKVAIATLFSKPTIEMLAEFMQADIAGSDYVSIAPVEKKEYYPLSSSQRRLYALQQMQSKNDAYNIREVQSLEGEVNFEKLDNIFRKLVERHEALRTSFHLVGGEPVQKIHDSVEFEIEYYHSTAGGDPSSVGGEEEFTAPTGEDGISLGAGRPFDLSQAPLLRVGLINNGKDKYLLIYEMHHIITDGVSMVLLAKDFVGLYESEELPALTLHYKDYSEWQKGLREKEKERVERQEKYWLEQFAKEVPLMEGLVDYERPDIKSYEGSIVVLDIDSDLYGKIKEMLEETRTTLYMVLLAVYNVLLWTYTGREDIVVGSPITGRPQGELQNIVGMFVNMLAMRNKPGKNKTFREFTNEVKENALNAFENGDYQFEDLVDKLNLHIKKNRNPLFDTVFQLQNIVFEEKRADNLKVAPYESKRHSSQFDLIFRASERNNSISIQLTYSKALFKRSKAQDMITRYIDILRQVAKNRDVKLKDIIISSGRLVSASKIHKHDDDDFIF